VLLLCFRNVTNIIYIAMLLLAFARLIVTYVRFFFFFAADAKFGLKSQCKIEQSQFQVYPLRKLYQMKK